MGNKVIEQNKLNGCIEPKSIQPFFLLHINGNVTINLRTINIKTK